MSFIRDNKRLVDDLFADNIGQVQEYLIREKYLYANEADRVFRIVDKEGYELAVDVLDFLHGDRGRVSERDINGEIGALIEFVTAKISREEYNIDLQDVFSKSCRWAEDVLRDITRKVSRHDDRDYRDDRGRSTGRAVAYRDEGRGGRAISYSDNRGGGAYQSASVSRQPASRGSSEPVRLVSSIANKPRGVLEVDRNQHVDESVPTQRTTSSIPQPQPSAFKLESRHVAERTPAPVREPEQVMSQHKAIRVVLQDKRKPLDDSYAPPALEGETVDILQLAEDSKPSLIYRTVTEHLPAPRENAPELVMFLDNLRKASTVQEIAALADEMQERFDAVKTYAWLSTKLTSTILEALRWRHNITNLDGFPLLTQTNEAIVYLEERNIVDDILSIAIKLVNECFANIHLQDFNIPQGEGQPDLVKHAIGIVRQEHLIILPWLCSYSPQEGSLEIHNAPSPETLQDVFHQAFQFAEPEVIYMDILDAAMNKYRVFRRGVKMHSQPHYIVESLVL